MGATLTTEQRLERVDRHVEDVKRLFVDAVSHLQQTPEIDGSFDERWSAIADRLRAVGTELQPEDFDKGQLAELFRAVRDIPELLERGRDLEACDQLLIRIERIRHVVRDALDEHVVGIVGTTAEVMANVNGWLPSTPRHHLAELLGVDRRTLLRWEEYEQPPGRRLQVVAQLVAILRHSWTEEGIVAWFHRRRRDLGGRTPLEVLGEDKFDESALITAARAGRSQYAS
jgi:hypothetical protein